MLPRTVTVGLVLSLLTITRSLFGSVVSVHVVVGRGASLGGECLRPDGRELRNGIAPELGGCDLGFLRRLYQLSGKPLAHVIGDDRSHVRHDSGRRSGRRQCGIAETDTGL